MLVGMPVVFLLLFVYVFGGTLGAGPGARGPAGGRADYIAYVVPGIIAMTVAISKASVLTGHVLGSMIQTLFGMAVVIAIALLVLFTLALTWLSVTMAPNPPRW